MSHRYFTSDIRGDAAHITGPDAAHLARVLRTRPGERLTLCDGSGLDYAAEVTDVRPEQVVLRILSQAPSKAEPGVWAEMFVAVGKGDKTDFAVQKAVELGASAIHLFYGERSVARPKNEAHKIERITRIAHEAAKQSARGILPAVGPILDFTQVLQAVPGFGAALLFHPDGATPLAQAVAGHSRLALITGPEGGFSPAEVLAARQAGCRLVGLGPRILRCETAPLAALAAVMALTGNLNPVE